MASLLRFMHYISNMPGDPPNCHSGNWKQVQPKKLKPKHRAQLEKEKAAAEKKKNKK